MKSKLHKESKILILDDDPLVAEFTSVTLTDMGFMKINIFCYVKPFIECVRLSTVDLLFIDINLYDMDGLVLLGWIKALQPESKVVMFSGDTRGGLVKEACQLGADGFLSKFELDKNIRQLLNKWNVNYPLI
ncbi:response regulator [Pseudoalteromonas sp. NBT06-2]|uniref:response regulator n=1 Tax=Pseudoalteromonas sp. NBT06-2 TaxID=2025950 RepID=UPI001483814E|nr:response regulator [Pseudoalteromonas sp. NBT06-2]